MLCAISGKTPDEPVVSTKSGHVFEKRLILKYLEANNNVCPITQQPLEPKDLIDVKSNKGVVARPTTATSIPSLLAIFQNEWDAVMLETFTLKQQLESVRQELAHALYQHDAACRVIARLIKERDEARNALANYRGNVPVSTPPPAEPSRESMEVEPQQPGLPEAVKQKMTEKSKELAPERKKRQVSASLASVEEIKEYKSTHSSTLHKTTHPGIASVDIHPTNQDLIVTGGVDGDIVLYSRDTGKMDSKHSGHKKQVNDVLFHPKEKIIFTASADHTAKVWRESDSEWEVIHTEEHGGEVCGVTLQATGDYWVSGSEDGYWSFHDLKTSTRLTKIHANSALSSVQFHPDGLLLGTGTVDSVIKIWDVKAQKNVANFEGHKGKIVDLTFSENGFYLASVAQDNVVTLWDLRKLKGVQNYDLPDDFGALSINFDYSGNYLAVSGSDIRILATKNFEAITSLSKHSKPVTDVKWGADAKFLVSVSMDRTLKLWGTK